MVDMAVGLGAGYMTGWNGYGAANSLDHCHFHALRVPLDDELPIQRFLRTALDTGEFSLHQAENGHGALAAAAALRPDHGQDGGNSALDSDLLAVPEMAASVLRIVVVADIG